MKKKFFALLLATLLIVCTVVTLVACDDKSSNDIGKLQINKKYIIKSTINSELTEQDIIDKSSQYLIYECYFIFYSDGTGIFVNNRITYQSTTVHCKYTLHFKYTYVNDDKSAVVCFYDSIEDNSTILSTKNPYVYSLNDWTTLLTVSKNVICTAGTSGYTYYINEDYAKELSNLNKKTDVTI
ncbi:MAG: hypothetical protein K2M64_00630 [Clostridia bacterium]|nr:hypothetical protein [Clostridia bacterium]